MKQLSFLMLLIIGGSIVGFGQTVPNKDWVKTYSSTDSLYNFPTAVDGYNGLGC